MIKKGQNQLNIFGLTAGQHLTKEVCDILGVEQKHVRTLKFADGEMLVESLDSVRGQEVYIIQSASMPVNDNYMELFIAIDAFKRCSAEKINVVIPYYGYARQDRKAKGRQPITSKLIADFLTKAGAHRVITFDLHSPQSMGFFDIPVDNFYTSQILADEIVNTIWENNFNPNDCILVSPDAGGVNRVHKVDSYTGSMTNGIATIGKRRPEPNKAEVEYVLGDIDGKVCFIIDDMIDTGGTILNAAKALKEHGAQAVYIFASHGLFNGQAPQKMEDALVAGIIKGVVVTNTIDIPQSRQFKGLKIVSIAQLLADMIYASANNESLSKVYDDEKERIRDRIAKHFN